jgi:hypothetical protein
MASNVYTCTESGCDNLDVTVPCSECSEPKRKQGIKRAREHRQAALDGTDAFTPAIFRGAKRLVRVN